MKRAMIGLLLVGLLPAGYAGAQPPIYPGDYATWNVPPGVPPPPPLYSQPYPPPPPPPPLDPPASRTDMTAYRVWAKVDYLLWFVSNGGPHVPLVTTDTNPASALAGSLASPTAIPLFGSKGFDYRAFSGMRLLAGTWFDAGDTVGAEVGGFLLERRSPTFSAASNLAGSPPLYVPAFNVTLGREDSLLVAAPKKFAGSVSVASPLRLWGAELNGVYHLAQSERWDVVLLGGFRYLDLGDSFLLQNTTSDLATGVLVSLADRFQARNQFYGGNVGIRLNATWGQFLTGLTVQTALGSTQETVTVSGATIANVAPTSFPGGFFAQPTNIGPQSHGAFAVVPQIGVLLGYHLTPRITALVGYDFLYWSDVVRAGNQVDRVLNATQNPILGATGGTLVGPARPASEFNHSGFIAHGVSLGLLWQY